MPRLTPYAAHEIAMVSSTPAGSGFPIGLMPGALPSDHASRQTSKTTAVRLPLGQSQFTGLVMPRHAPRFPGHVISGPGRVGKGALISGATWAASVRLCPRCPPFDRVGKVARGRCATHELRQATLPTLRVHVRNASRA